MRRKKPGEPALLRIDARGRERLCEHPGCGRIGYEDEMVQIGDGPGASFYCGRLHGTILAPFAGPEPEPAA